MSFAKALTFDSSNQISFSINGVDFTFDANTTLQTMINTVNADEDAGRHDEVQPPDRRLYDHGRQGRLGELRHD